MKNYNDFGVYDFSDYAEELVGEALIRVNGGSCGGGFSGGGAGGGSGATGGSSSGGTSSGGNRGGSSGGTSGGGSSSGAGACSGGGSSSGGSSTGGHSGTSGTGNTGSQTTGTSGGTTTGSTTHAGGTTSSTGTCGGSSGGTTSSTQSGKTNTGTGNTNYSKPTKEDYINQYNINPNLPTDVKLKLIQKERDHDFATKVVDYIGTKYVLGGDSKDGIDCSGLIIAGVKDLGYNVPDASAAELASGNTEWVSISKSHSEKNAGDEGIINFYKLGNSDSVNHTNVGVGPEVNHPKDSSYKSQIVDATSGDTMLCRTGAVGQYLSPGSGVVNQTYAPFSTKESSYPISQGRIDWDVLDEKYRR